MLNPDKENEQLVIKVKLLETEIKKLQESLIEHKKMIDINATKAPIQLYVIGKYDNVDKEKGVLSIFVEGNINYYPLEYYASSRLPFPDSRVLIFNVENQKNTPYILGFDGGRLIKPSQAYLATVVSIDFIHSMLITNVQEYGNIRVHPSAEFLTNVKIKSGMKLKIRKIQIATEMFFIPILNTKVIELDSNKMYTFLSKLI